MDDKARIVDKLPLSCRIMDSAQSLLCPVATTAKIDGWQPVLFGKKYAFKAIRGEFIQILHIRDRHWVTASNIRCETGCVCIYDSYYQSVDLDTKMQVCSLLKSKEDEITFMMANMQCQGNTYDCGLYAIATATELTHRRDPCLCHWDVDLLRPHLAKCLEKGTLTPFPISKRRRVPLGNRFKGRATKVKIYCICRMPNKKDTPMVQCGKCFVWFHITCIKPGMSEVKLKKVEWFCESCQILH